MNKIINGITFFFGLIASFYSIILHFELEVFNLKWNLIPYVQETFLVLACIIGAFGMIRIYIRRRNVKIFQHKNNFIKIFPIDKSALSMVNMNLIMEAIFMAIFASFFFFIKDYTTVLGFVFLIFLIEQLIFLLQCQQSNFCKIGITKKAIISVDRETSVLYFNGLKSIHVDLGRLYFDYKQDIQLSLRKENISSIHRKEFDTIIRQRISNKEVIFGKGYIDYIECK